MIAGLERQPKPLQQDNMKLQYLSQNVYSDCCFDELHHTHTHTHTQPPKLPQRVGEAMAAVTRSIVDWNKDKTRIVVNGSSGITLANHID